MDMFAEYRKILDEYKKDTGPPSGGLMEQRSHPRLKIQSDDLWINTVPEFALENMSATGMAIRSSSPLEQGELIHISLGTSFSVDAEVVTSRMLAAPDEFTDGEFLIQCRFLEDMKGMDLLVKTVRYQS